MAAFPANADGGQPLTGTGRLTLLRTAGGAAFGALTARHLGHIAIRIGSLSAVEPKGE
ncbi:MULTISPECIES: hypothetical protein [unclassified Streptomyces]|uniref:hypothetical protein n=1 Tax=unclassified Streptomyces TaxID=2593676 RepID=UPI00339E1DD3